MTEHEHGRRSLLLAAAAAGLSAALPPSVRAAAARIVYWHHFTSQDEFAGLQKVMGLFAQRYPAVTLTQENIPNPDYMAKFTAAVLANARPDVTMVAAERLADMLAMGGLVDLSKHLAAWPQRGEYAADRWIGCSSGGKTYGVPAFTFVDWMYYRRDWFAQAGLDGPPRTTDEFLIAAKKLTDPSKNRYGFGMRGGAGGGDYMVDLIEAFGSPIVVDGKNAMDRSRATAAVKWYSELATVHKVVPPSVAGDGFRQIMEGFKTGQTAMLWHHTGSLTDMVRSLPGTALGTAERPAGPAKHVARLSYLFNGIMKPDNMDAAWDWVTFWGTPDAAIAFLEATGYFPASSKIAQDSRITGNPLYAPAVATLSFGSLPPSFVGGANWRQNVVLPELQKVLVGQSTPERATDAMMKGLDAALS